LPDSSPVLKLRKIVSAETLCVMVIVIRLNVSMHLFISLTKKIQYSSIIVFNFSPWKNKVLQLSYWVSTSYSPGILSIPNTAFIMNLFRLVI